ncbi:MAG: hypothetical protein Q4C54_00635 [Clostridia bacterium]|nr:hypothetical protein [Clostridia bacterium]
MEEKMTARTGEQTADRLLPSFSMLPVCDIPADQPTGVVGIGHGSSRWLRRLADRLGGTGMTYAAKEKLAGAIRDKGEAYTCWRGMLAMLLLWDLHRDAPQALEAVCWDKGTPLAAMLLEASGLQDSAAFGEKLCVMTLRQGGRQLPVAIPDREALLVPAVDASLDSDVIPPWVTWFDRDEGKMQDPVGLMNETEREVLVKRLQLFLQAYGAEESALSQAVRQLAEDTAKINRDAREALSDSKGSAVQELALRIEAILGLKGHEAFPGLTGDSAVMQTGGTNPVLSALHIPHSADRKLVCCTTYRWNGVPFARDAERFVYEPTGHADEAAALDELSLELDLAAEYIPHWNEHLSGGLSELWEKCKRKNRLYPAVTKTVFQLFGRADKQKETKPVVLNIPEERGLAAAGYLMKTLLGDDAAQLPQKLFSDRLTLVPFAALADGALAQAAFVRYDEDGSPLCALPPLSAALTAFLTERAHITLQPEGLRFLPADEEGSL